MRDWHYRPARDFGLPAGERLASAAREPTLVESLLHHLSWEVIRAWLRLHQRLEVVNREHIPRERPFVLVANHSSHLDALVLGSLLPPRLRGEVFAVAAADTFFARPALATLSAMCINALPLWRNQPGRNGLLTLRQRLEEDQGCLILFPEGTRSRDGRMARFKPGIGVLVAGTDVPVIPCHIGGAHASWPPERARPARGRIRAVLGPPRRFGREANAKAGWLRVAEELERAVRALGGA